MIINFVKMKRVSCDYCGSWNYEFATTFPERKNVCVFCFLSLDVNEMKYEKCLKEWDKIKHYIPKKEIIDRAYEEIIENYNLKDSSWD